MARQTDDFSALLKVGRYEIESERVGTVHTAIAADRIDIQLSIDVSALRFALQTSGLVEARNPDEDMAQRVALAVAEAAHHMGTWQREWLTYTLVANYDVRRMTAAEFLEWAKTRSSTLDLWLVVPAVRAQIQAINEGSNASHRTQLAKLMARITNARPKRLPHVRVLRAEAREILPTVSRLYERMAAANNRSTLWSAIQKAEPKVAEQIEQYGLRDRWFATNAPSSQNRTPTYMVREWLAARHQSTPGTIGKLIAEPKRKAAQRRS